MKGKGKERVKGKEKEEEGEQKEHFTAFYKEEGIGTVGRERGERKGGERSGRGR